MIPYKVIKINKNPRKMKFIMDHVTVVYWSVPVLMQAEDEVHESTVTFESLEEALKLKIGDEFER